MICERAFFRFYFRLYSSKASSVDCGSGLPFVSGKVIETNDAMKQKNASVKTGTMGCHLASSSINGANIPPKRPIADAIPIIDERK